MLEYVIGLHLTPLYSTAMVGFPLCDVNNQMLEIVMVQWVSSNVRLR
jgi:hypothetical protein